MRIRVLGGGWYGCSIARALLKRGYSVELHESAASLFSGASGNMPGRLHLGFHYPRSRLTRAACQDHYAKFMAEYGHLTRGVPVNIYAIADKLSLVDFGNYCQSLKDEVQFVKVERPGEFGLQNVEGALLTGERHTVVRRARAYFTEALKDVVRYKVPPNGAIPYERIGEAIYDLTIDCTFCAQESEGVDRYEPCVTGLLRGPTNMAVTVMDGPPFGSVYPWDEVEGLCSISAANLTPLTKHCHSYDEAREILASLNDDAFLSRVKAMVDQMAHYFPAVADDYEIVGYMKAIRAMPLSGADARLVDVVRVSPKTLRIRASKLDAIFYAEDVVMEAIRAL